jgi:hypothetical protein
MEIAGAAEKFAVGLILTIQTTGPAEREQATTVPKF